MEDEVLDMGKMSRKKYESNKKFNDKTYEQLGFRSRKEERLDELIAIGADKKNVSKSSYMIDAIKTQLSHDGITIDMLPQDTRYTPQLEAKTPKRYLVYMVTEKFLDESDPNSPEDEFEFDFIFNPEEYVSVFQTLKAARDYIANKFKRKAHPEQWAYTIYGRSFETKNKRDAYDAYRQMAYDTNNIVNGPSEDGDMVFDFVQVMEEKQKPEYVEVVRYEDVEDHGEDN